MQPAEFQGKHVYITGGSMGIGLAVASRVAALGADVTIFARHREPLERAVETIAAARQRPDQRVGYRELDVGNHAEVLNVMAAAVGALGAPDVLINCAGGARPRRFEEIAYEQLADTLRVNLHGSWSTVQALLPHLKARRGYVVNTASIAGLIGVFGYTDYCASKFALVGFSEALRSELKPHGVTVSVLCPPDTDTPGFATENTTKPEETQAISASARVMSADAVADALLHGMARRAFLIIPGLDGRLSVLAKRLAPWLVARVMDRTVARVARARQSSLASGKQQ